MATSQTFQKNEFEKGVELKRRSLEQVVEMTSDYMRRKEDAEFEKAFADLNY